MGSGEIHVSAEELTEFGVGGGGVSIEAAAGHLALIAGGDFVEDLGELVGSIEALFTCGDVD